MTELDTLKHHIDSRLDRAWKGIDELRSGLDNFGKQFEELTKAITSIDSALRGGNGNGDIGLLARVSALESRVMDNKVTVRANEQEIDKLELRIEGIETKKNQTHITIFVLIGIGYLVMIGMFLWILFGS